MICSRCGKELSEGEICSCTENASAENTSTSSGENHTVTEDNAAQTSTAVQTVPDVQADENTAGGAADAAKKAAESFKQNPIVSELISVFKGAMKSPVKQTVASGRRKDILWAIFAAAELIISALAITITARHLLFIVGKTAVGTYFDISWSDFAAGLSSVGAGAFKLFALNFLFMLIIFACFVVLIAAVLAIFRKKAGFANICNMFTTAYIPSAVFMLGALIFGWIYAPVSIILIFLAAVSAVMLNYMGMQKLDKFETSPFWAYIAVVAAVFLVSSFTGGRFTAALISDVIDAFKNMSSSLFSSLLW